MSAQQMTIDMPNTFTLSEYNGGNGEQQYLFQYKENYYVIGKNIFEMLTMYQQGISRLDEMQSALNDSNLSISIEEVRQIYDERIVPLFQSKKQQKSVKSIIELLNPTNLYHYLSYFFGLFRGKIFWLWLGAAFCINLAYFASAPSLAMSSLSNVQIAFVFLLLFVLLLGHEFGHSIACLAHGAKAGKIGVGFYFFVPILYADVSDIWRLSKWERIKVNLAGVYVQYLLGVALIVMAGFAAPPLKAILVKLFFLSFSISLINLFPLLKFDGYWIYSDLFDIANLRSRSDTQLKRLITFDSGTKGSMPLIVYAISYAIFIVFITYKLISILMGSAYLFLYQISSSDFNLWSVGWGFVRNFTISVVILVFVFFKIMWLWRLLMKK